MSAFYSTHNSSKFEALCAPGIPVPLEDLQHGRLDDPPASLGVFVGVGAGCPLFFLDNVGHLKLYHGGRLLPLVVIAVRRGGVSAGGQVQRCPWVRGKRFGTLDGGKDVDVGFLMAVFQRNRIQEILSQTGPYRIRSRSFYQDSGTPEYQKMPD